MSKFWILGQLSARDRQARRNAAHARGAPSHQALTDAPAFLADKCIICDNLDARQADLRTRDRGHRSQSGSPNRACGARPIFDSIRSPTVRMTWATHQCKESAPPSYSQRTLPETPRMLSVNRTKQDPYLHPPFLKMESRQNCDFEGFTST